MFIKISVEEIKEALSGNSYHTPADAPRYLGDRLLFNSRWWFYVRFAGIVIGSSRLARKGKYDDEAWYKSSFMVLRHIEGCGGRFHIEGLDNLRKSDAPLVIVGNHMSTLETVVLPSLIAPLRPLTFVVKESLAQGKIFGPVMRSRKPILVGRKDPREDLKTVLEQGKKILENGRSLVIFPQSTRTLDFDPKQFNSLGIKLAKRAGVEILPLAIKTDFWGDSKIIKGFGKLNRKIPIRMTFGEPLTIEGNGKEEHAKVVDFITSQLDRWKHEKAK